MQGSQQMPAFSSFPLYAQQITTESDHDDRTLLALLALNMSLFGCIQCQHLNCVMLWNSVIPDMSSVCTAALCSKDVQSA